MWPFKSKEAKELEIDRQAIEYDRIDEIKAWRDIGEEFNYMGVKCLITHHYEFETRYHFYGMAPPMPYPFKKAAIKAHYVDNQGKIHAVSFSYSEFGNLVKQNKT